MILTCEECQTRYLVPDHAIGADGRRVRCVNCGHEWFQEPEQDEEPTEPIEEPAAPEEIPEEPEEIIEPDEPEEIPDSVKPVDDSDLPAIAAAPEPTHKLNKGVIKGYSAALLIFIFIACALYLARDAVVKLWPASVMLYDMAGVETTIDGQDLLFDQLHAVAQLNEDGVQVLDVTANILNLAHEKARVPYIQASIIGAEGQVLDSWLVEPQAETIDAGGDLAFHTSYPYLPDDVKEVNVKFITGTKVQGAAAAEDEESSEESHEPAHEEDTHDAAAEDHGHDEHEVAPAHH